MEQRKELKGRVIVRLPQKYLPSRGTILYKVDIIVHFSGLFRDFKPRQGLNFSQLKIVFIEKREWTIMSALPLALQKLKFKHLQHNFFSKCTKMAKNGKKFLGRLKMFTLKKSLESLLGK